MNNRFQQTITKPKIRAYKLSEIAKIEGKHYQTIIQRNKRGLYVPIVLTSGTGKNEKTTYRYLTKDASDAFRAIFPKGSSIFSID